MKDKTHSMNMEADGAGAVKGFERLSNSEIMSERARKLRQMKWANIEDNDALQKYENKYDSDEDHLMSGFLPRNNYEDRY